MDLDQRARTAVVELRRNLGDRDIELGLQQIHERMGRRRPVRIMQIAAACTVALALVAGLLLFRSDGQHDEVRAVEPGQTCNTTTETVVAELSAGGHVISVRRTAVKLELLVDGNVASQASLDEPGGSRVAVPFQGQTILYGFVTTRPASATVSSTDGTVNPLTLAHLPDGYTVFVGPVVGSPDLGTLSLVGNAPAPACL